MESCFGELETLPVNSQCLLSEFQCCFGVFFARGGSRTVSQGLFDAFYLSLVALRFQEHDPCGLAGAALRNKSGIQGEDSCAQ